MKIPPLYPCIFEKSYKVCVNNKKSVKYIGKNVLTFTYNLCKNLVPFWPSLLDIRSLLGGNMSERFRDFSECRHKNTKLASWRQNRRKSTRFWAWIRSWIPHGRFQVHIWARHPSGIKIYENLCKNIQYSSRNLKQSFKTCRILKLLSFLCLWVPRVG